MFKIKRLLIKLKKQTGPTQEFRTELWVKLSDECDKDVTVQAVKGFSFKFAVAGVVVFVLLFSTGTGVYAYESDSVSEGHMLFPMKRGVENVEGWFAKGAKEQAEYHMKMMDRRLDEAERDCPKEHCEKMLEYAAEELGMTVDELKDEFMDPETRESIVEQLSEQNERFAEIFENAPMPPVPELPYSGVRERLRDMEQRLEQSDLTEDQKQRMFRKHFDRAQAEGQTYYNNEIRRAKFNKQINQDQYAETVN